ncbi:MAG: hypothetical protein JWO41_831 [Candidatus Saccharibacteria bacterium]|nr:hypothetical protein [Candidatus Saccharibacteria bacterium]
MNKQRGFSAVIVLLVITVIVLTGAVGWQVMSKHTTYSPATASSSETQSTKSVTKTTATPSKGNNSVDFLVIKEWGTKVQLNDKVAGLYLDKTGFRSTALDALSSSKCGGTNSVVVMRGMANDQLPGETGDAGTYAKNYATYIANTSTTTVHVKIGDYYYLTPAYRGASCVTDSSNVDKEGSTIKAIFDAVNQMVAL